MAGPRRILVTGATGKQGGAVIKALLARPPPFDHQIVALTRDPESAKARALKAHANVQVVQGNLNESAAIFDKVAATDASSGPSSSSSPSTIWGVFLVTVLGPARPDKGELGEEAAGKGLIDAAVAHGVEHLVFSSVDRGGPGVSDTNPTATPHFASKHNIELHLKAKVLKDRDTTTTTTTTYTILRPVAFMDNLGANTFGALFSAMWKGVGSKPLQLIATKDIGIVAAQAFAAHGAAEYKNQAISLAGDELNHQDAAEIFSRTVGSPMPESYWFLGALLKLAMREVGTMFAWFRDVGFGADIAQCRKLNPDLLDFEAFLKEESDFRR